MPATRIVRCAGSFVAGLLIGARLLAGEPAGSPPAYVGVRVCAECHAAETERWRGSYHDHAMAEATEASVLGDFGDVAFTALGVSSRLDRRDGGYWVRTDGPDGTLTDYQIRYTFGWWPLQQYLIELPGGRLQALGIAWDSRAMEQGGQRWFHLYPNEPMDHRHPLHWTGREQNWNYQCAECHSTNLHKGYDLATDSFKTAWSEINVGCEACHGPGSQHVAEARSAAASATPQWGPEKGLVVDLADRDGGVWALDPETGKPKRRPARASRTQVEVCARCHSRRGQLSEDYVHGRPLGDSHRLALLDAALYHPDGQIKDEVYVYGSFIQSRMYAQGVVCTDCHDAHSLKPKLPGNLVCAQCHAAGTYDVEAHHHHPPGSTGASCVACHMPQQLYMVVDERADHSLRIPRPDLTLKIGSPNACNACHQEQTPEWAADAVRQWYGDGLERRPHYGEAIYAGRTGAAGAGQALVALAGDLSQPGIARATALDLLRDYAEATQLLAVRRLLADPDPWVRAAAARYLEVTDAPTRFELGMPLLADPVLVVRTEAARVLAPLAAYELPQQQAQALARGLAEYRAAELATAERPESHLNLGLVEAARGDPQAAERDYRTALRLDARFAPAYVNLADLYRTLGRDADGEALLRQGLAAVSDDPSLHHTLGLLQVRKGEASAGRESLARAAELAPDNPRYAYVHALAVHGTGDLPGALTLLRAARERHPRDRDILIALYTISRDSGDSAAASAYEAELRVLLGAGVH